jgi:peptidyl-prolyl cis-trans isomerase C
VASQGGASVTLADIDAFAERIPPEKRQGFFNSPTRIDGVITNLLLQKQLAAEARKAGIQADPEAVKKGPLAEEEALANARMQRFREELKIPDFEALAQEHYLAHKQDFAIPGKLTVKQILVSNKTRTEADARALADKVEQEAKANPGNFDALVQQYSDDPGKATDLGLVNDVAAKGKYVISFVRAAKALARPGDVSPVFRTPYGLQVIQLVERQPDTQQPFEAVKADIIRQLHDQYVENAVKQHGDVLRNQPMTADANLVASLRTRYGEAPTPAASQTPAPKAKGAAPRKH